MNGEAWSDFQMRKLEEEKAREREEDSAWVTEDFVTQRLRRSPK